MTVQGPSNRASPASSARLRVIGLWSAAQVDGFVPVRLRADSDQVRRARLLIGFSFFIALAGATFFVLTVVTYGTPALEATTAVVTLTAALTPLLLRQTGSLRLAMNGMLAVNLVGILAASVFIEQHALLALPWLASMPLLATSVAGRRAGIAWALAGILAAEGYYALERMSVLPKKVAVSLDLLRTAGAWGIGLFVFLVLGFALVNESVRVGTMAALGEAQRKLEAARDRTAVADRLASLEKMAAGVAHEVNNPMTFVSSNVELLRLDLERGPLDAQTQREYVEDILPATEAGLRRVIDIVGDLRRFARRDAQTGVEVDLNREVQAALRVCEGVLGDCRLTVRLGELPTIVGRPSQVARVAMNLVVNAAHAVREGGEVRVETESAGEEVVLRVIDDGVGMTPEVKARLFEPFFTTKPVGEGTGLGLSVVHGIVAAHGGSVHVASEPHGGSTFEVRLPTAPVQSSRR